MTAEDLLTTPFAVNYNTRMAGLVSATGSYDCYVDSTTALPAHGSADVLTVDIDGTFSYSIPINVISAEPRVSADGADRHLTVSWESNGDFTEIGGAPVVGVSGNATFVAQGGRQYVGDIVIIRIGISMTAARDAAEFTFGFVGDGDPIPA